jgi:hypothetical protein
LQLEDPVAALEAAIEASCATWEAHGFIVEQLQAIAILEPEAGAIVEQQKDEQRADLQGLTRRLARAGRLRPGLGEARVSATLHLLTSLEAFLWLRREYGLSLGQTRDTIAELAHQLLRTRDESDRIGVFARENGLGVVGQGTGHGAVALEPLHGTLFPGDTVRQLGEVKRRWDPDGLFRANFTLAAA